jgi:hypothetical protein
MLFRIRLRPKICFAILKGKDHLTFNTLLVAWVEADIALCLNADYNKAFKYALN